ncbi:MAG: diguanylate cyclase, partial [Campylobacterota bacterium]|nr:diguanylate cyclase [Campylobacterota bacterium]
MLLPTVEEICVKEIVTININSSIEDAVKKMAQNNVRSVLVLDSDCINYYIFTTSDAIDFRIQNKTLSTKLSEIKLQKAHKIDANISVLELLDQEDKDNQYHVVVNENKIVGILSQTDIINNLDPQIIMYKQTIGNLLLQYSPVTIYENEAAVNVIKIMQSRDIDAVIVLDNNNEASGIFTTKDFIDILDNQSDLNLPINNFMSSPLITVDVDIKISEAFEFIKEKHFKRIVVSDLNGNIEGLITQNELLRIMNNKWMEVIKQKGNELSKINEDLIKKTENLEKTASTDFLTNLYNRRKFDALLNYELKQIQRYKNRDLSIIIFDIDNFKKVNDTYGHDTGDKILQEIAQIVIVSIRNSDVACRWGGEEFAITLSHTNIEEALLVAQKIRITIQDHSFTDNLKITCSFGISQFHTSDKYETLFK